MFFRFQYYFCGIYYRLSGKFIRLGAWYFVQYGGVGYRFDKYKYVGWRRIVYIDYRVDYRFSNYFRFVKVAENIQYISGIFWGYQRVWRYGGYFGINQCGSVRYGADNFSVMVQRAGKLVERDICSNRNDQRVFIQVGGDFVKYFNYDVRFNGSKNDVGDLRYFLRRFCGVDVELVMQGGDFIRGGGVYLDLFWKYLIVGNQIVENGFFYIVVVNKIDFFFYCFIFVVKFIVLIIVGRSINRIMSEGKSAI